MTDATTDNSERNQPLGLGCNELLGGCSPERANAPHAPCPNPPTGRKCPLCGGELYCMEPWRAKA